MAVRLCIDGDWKFGLGHFCDPDRDFGYGEGDQAGAVKTGDAVGPMRPDFDDSGWRSLNLPHDWAVELTGVIDADPYHAYKPLGRRFPGTSVGWYRKELDLSRKDTTTRAWIVFDGVFRDSVVWINGHYLGRHLSGYTGFRYEVSDYLVAGVNILAVRVDATAYEGWFYEGAGVYRHVWFETSHSTRVAHNGLVVRYDAEIVSHEISHEMSHEASRDVSRDVSVELTIDIEVEHAADRDAEYSIDIGLFDQAGGRIESHESETLTAKAWETRTSAFRLVIPDPDLWSVTEPSLYRVTASIVIDGAVVDTAETQFGVRGIRFDPDSGFFLNGEPFTLKGVCCHQDVTGTGTAVPDRMWEYRILKLKEMGCNAYRCAHNPPSQELLDTCDRLGMLVIDEARIMGSSGEALDQLAWMIRRDRNHPCIILWCLGNEEHILQGSEVGTRIVKTMKRYARKLDPTRLSTCALNGEWGSGFSREIDVLGCNYLVCGDVDEFHREYPTQPIVATETASTFSTRGSYIDDKNLGHTSSYGETLPGWGSSPEAMWKYWSERPFVAGVFVWTGFDYRGEPLPFNWPCVNANFGIMDLCGFSKDIYYYYQAWWRDVPVLHILPHWNWEGNEGRIIDVRCFGNSDEVELLLNGRSLGRKKMHRYSHLKWDVKYEPGRLEARGYTKGSIVSSAIRETTGAPAGIVLESVGGATLAGRSDIAIVNVAIVDDRDRIVPTAGNAVSFEVSAPGRCLGVSNGDPSYNGPENTPECRVFNGLCQIIVGTSADNGEIAVTARARGFGLGVITLYVREV
jgi:beta-galactosidase